jgi:hypothetical protein
MEGKKGEERIDIKQKKKKKKKKRKGEREKKITNSITV